jgi:hypothetical protein
MRNPDTTTDAGACLARIAALEAQRMAALVHRVREPEQAVIRAIVTQQQTDALAFARRAAP